MSVALRAKLDDEKSPILAPGRTSGAAQNGSGYRRRGPGEEHHHEGAVGAYSQR